VDPKERWQALQAHLAVAQERLNAADRAGALNAVNAALAIDPNFLAAQALRDRAMALTVAEPVVPTPVTPIVQAPVVGPAPASKDGYAQFEQRARRRRVDRRVDAARAALAAGRASEAAAAIDEIRELDPNLPDLRELTAALSGMAQPRSPRIGRWMAAAAVFAGILFGATWLQESGALGSRGIVAVAPLVSPPEPLGVDLAASAVEEPDNDTAVATAGRVPAPAPLPQREPVRVAMTAPAIVPPAAAPPSQPSFTAVPLSGVAPASLPAPAAPPPVPTAPAPAPAAASPSSSAVVPVPLAPDDEKLVKQTLQRYRSAYEGLDAHSARAVWPAVNEAALARAFDGLESQAFVFDACDVTVHGEAANAICRGTAKYVPKVGSREPRVEPRTWNFTLRKGAGAWTIESARAQR
jgi:hypothetical protein